MSTTTVHRPRDVVHEGNLLGQQVARELRRRWRRGERPSAEELLNQHPELLTRSETALEVVYEEFCLRADDGEDGVEQDLLRRFPQWSEPLRVMLDCHRLLQPETPPDYPVPGDWLGEFHLLGELGRGGRGRVFLASQSDLADRLVVLKLTPLDGVEHLSLARLQHTNIVPVYSVAADSARRLRILVMPHFGRATLASLLIALAEVPPADRRGQAVVAAMDAAHDPLLVAPPAGPARQMLAHVSYTQAVCWIAACLADALQYAHDRGLVHLDVKPSNVLLSVDGQPMLLDFHLTREPLRRDGPAPDRFGGTLDYMPPEQREAMQALHEGLGVETDVDARADIFALGAVLYELLGGRLPLRADSPPLDRINSQVGCGLSDMVAKCLSPRPGQRYASAAALAVDLRRHLADQPLVGVRNRSLTERWHKWRRRQPHTLRMAGLLAVVALAALFAVGSSWWHLEQRGREAAQALLDGQHQLRSGQPREAVQTLERGLALRPTLPFGRDLGDQLREQLAIARRQQLIAELHQLANRLRLLSGMDLPTAAQRQPFADLCRQFWEKRQTIATRLAASAEADVAADLLDVAICWAKLQRQLEPDPVAARELALRTLADAEELFGSSVVLDYERALCRGEPLPARGPPPLDTAPRTVRQSAWEHYALGRALLDADRVSEAAAELDAARDLDPAGLWPNFYFGLCTHRLGRFHDAIAAFSVCIGADPKLAGCFYNRALSHQALNHLDAAQRDFARALELDPTFAAPINAARRANQHSRAAPTP